MKNACFITLHCSTTVKLHKHRRIQIMSELDVR